MKKFSHAIDYNNNIKFTSHCEDNCSIKRNLLQPKVIDKIKFYVNVIS